MVIRVANLFAGTWLMGVMLHNSLVLHNKLKIYNKLDKTETNISDGIIINHVKIN